MKENDENALELTNIEKKNGEANETSVVKEDEKITLRERLRRFVCFFTVEPILIFYFLPSAIASLTINQLNLEKSCRTVLNLNESICKDVILGIGDDNATIEARQEASQAVASMMAWQYPIQSAVPGILILFFGAWSDRTGNRKALMMIPILGEIVSVTGLLFAVYYFLEWPLWTTAWIESLPTALSGGSAVALLGAYSYLADVTTEESRTFRIGLVAVIVTLSFPLGTAVSGIMVQEIGYYGVLSIQLVLYIVGITYTYFRIHNVRNEEMEGTFMKKVGTFFNPYNIWDTISIVIVSPRKQIIRMILVILVLMLIMGPVIGESSVFYLYVINRYGMNAVDISLFSTYSILMSSAGTTIAISLFSKHWKMNDALLGIIGTACKTVSAVVYGLAPTRQWFFSGPAFDFFGNAGVTAIRSLGTKVVDPDKVGKMCSLISLVDSLVPVIYVPLYTKTYKLTLSTLPGTVYFLGSTMTAPAFFVFIALYFMHRKEEKDAVKNPTAKEMHAHDNDITSL